MNGDLEALLEFVAAISPYTKALESRLEKLEAVNRGLAEQLEKRMVSISGATSVAKNLSQEIKFGGNTQGSTEGK